MAVTVVALYVSLYVAFIMGQWYVSICPIVALALWCASVTYALHRYYRRQASKPLFWVSVSSMVSFAVASLLYIGFSPVPYELLSHRDVAILVAQLLMAASCVIFVSSVAVHTRCVSYQAVVARSFTTI